MATTSFALKNETSMQQTISTLIKDKTVPRLCTTAGANKIIALNVHCRTRLAYTAHGALWLLSYLGGGSRLVDTKSKK
jgi:hypothetical protein